VRNIQSCDLETIVSTLETRVHSSSFCPGLGIGLETWWPRSRSWSRDLKKGLDNTDDILAFWQMQMAMFMGGATEGCGEQCPPLLGSAGYSEYRGGGQSNENDLCFYSRLTRLTQP